MNNNFEDFVKKKFLNVQQLFEHKTFNKKYFFEVNLSLIKYPFSVWRQLQLI